MLYSIFSQNYSDLYKNDFDFENFSEIDKELFEKISNVHPKLMYAFEKLKEVNVDFNKLEGIRVLQRYYNSIITQKNEFASKQIVLYQNSDLHQYFEIKNYFKNDFVKKLFIIKSKRGKKYYNSDENKINYYIYKHILNDPSIIYSSVINYKNLLEIDKIKKTKDIAKRIESYSNSENKNNLFNDIATNSASQQKKLFSNYYYLFKNDDKIMLNCLQKIGVRNDPRLALDFTPSEDKSHLYLKINSESEFQNTLSSNVINLGDINIQGSAEWFYNSSTYSTEPYNFQLSSDLNLSNINLLNIGLGYYFKIKDKKALFSHIDISYNYSKPLNDYELITSVSSVTLKDPINGSSRAVITEYKNPAFKFSRSSLSLVTQIAPKVWYFEGLAGINIVFDNPFF